MERHTFPVAVGSLVLLVAAISFPALRSRNNSSVLAASQPVSPQRLQNVVETRAPDSCPVTKPPTHAFVPPSPYPTEWGQGWFWFGTAKLWTALPAGGTDGLRQKRFWWREGYDWRKDQQPKLIVSGKRLGSPSAPVILDDEASNGGATGKYPPFIVDAFDVPAPGCWKLTARYKDGKLSFVVWVTQ
jgi:hypothetical protein